MVTMLLGGLWHGANWTFVAWGGLHGFYLWVEKFFRDRKSGSAAGTNAGTAVLAEVRPAPVQASLAPSVGLSGNAKGFVLALLTFFLINVTWVFFRSSTFGMAGHMLVSLFGGARDAAPVLTTLAIMKVTIIVTGMVVGHWFMRNRRMLDLVYKMPWWVTGMLWAIVLLVLILTQSSSASFIYFQF
jgi:D-alanyl-lipoteichoic acid acyltransferase DltB (MBOAT superfamily)